MSKQTKYGVIVEIDERRILHGEEVYVLAAESNVPRTAAKPHVIKGLDSEEQMLANVERMQRNYPSFEVYPVEAFPYIIDFAKYA